MTFKTAAHIARLAANNNTHLQLASSNTFRSYIVLRQPAVQSVQLARTTPFFCAGRLSGRNQMQEKNSKKKFAEIRKERRAASPKTFTGVSQARRFQTAANLAEIFYNFER